jgi:hypothetical protein
MSIATRPIRRRKRIAPLTEIRAERLRSALKLAEVSLTAGINSYRLSLIERDLETPTPEELFRLHAAIAALAAERRA